MDYLIHILCLAGIYSIAVLGFNFASGYTGLISLSHGAFMGIGAYASAILLTSVGLSFPVAFLLGGLLAGLVAWLFSFVLLRLRDDSFVLVSFGFSFIVSDVLLNWQSLTNGALGLRGIPYPHITLLVENQKLVFLLLIVVVLLVCFFFLRSILRSPYGVIIRATRENQKITQIAGHDTDSYRRSVFVLSAIITGFAGVLLGSFISTIDPFFFNYHLSVLILIMAIFGGLASLWGSILGATLLILLPEALRFIGLPSSILAESQQIIYGFVLIVLMVYRPKGLLGEYKI
jgi:branched-chain amino acid transport system permease protein